MLDLVVRNGQIVDGTGSARRPGAVGVRDGRIVAIGDVDEPATRVIDADGAVVAPGFVDVHTHYDAQVLWDPTLSPSILHGVTTAIGGNCGFSVAPLTREGSAYLLSMLARVEGMPLAALEAASNWDWHSTGEYLDRLEGEVAPNVGFMVGHTAIRQVVMGAAAKEREATDDELAAMQALLRAGLAAGGLGFSTSIARSHNDAEGDPVPSRCASHHEILELAAVCREFEGTVLEMVPHAGPEPFPEPVAALMTKMTTRAARPLDWNILHASAANRDEVAAKLAVSDRARDAGGKIVGLMMPMPIALRLNFLSGFVLDMLPGWDKLMALPPATKLAMMHSREGRAELLAPLPATPTRFDNWGIYVIDQAFTDATRRFEGHAVGDIAREQGQDPFDALMDIVVADDLHTSIAFPSHGTSAADRAARRELLQDPRIVVGASDAGAHLDMIDTFRYTTALLAECRGDDPLATTEEAVRLLTQVPAELHGLRGRGVLREGAWADLVVFDEATVGCGEVEVRPDLPGDERRLFASPTGVTHVVVNGRTIVEQGAVTDDRPGRVLRSGRDTATPRLA
jgi:N-acyl-D-aspartate/D-glutamate deacylase